MTKAVNNQPDKRDYESKFLKTISDGLRHAIRDHGPITKEQIGSAAKRIYSRLRGTKYESVIQDYSIQSDIEIGKDWLLYKDAATRIVARISDNDCLTCKHWDSDAVYAIAVELATNARTAASPAAPHCGFCGKSNTEVKALIEAPVGYICEGCVAICADIVERNGVAAPKEEAPPEHLHSVCTFKLTAGDRFYSYRTGTICEALESVRVIIKEAPQDFIMPTTPSLDAAPKEEIEVDDQIIRWLLNQRKWYSEDIFRPWTIEEARRVHAEFPGAVDRIAAESVRKLIDRIIVDIREGKHNMYED